MAQRKYWNYKDDDSTFDFIQWHLGIDEPGRFRGFDPILGAGLTLTLDHATTGADKTGLDGVTITRYGIWLSKQGTVVSETTAINLPIAAGDPTNPRIDLIVAQHEYVVVVGGAAATYLVIQGTPAPNPVAPALTIPSKQTILGQIYVPANMTDLNGTGVVYTQAAVPNYGNDGTIAHTDRTNDFEELQIVRGLEEYGGVATLDTAGSSTIIFLRDSGGTDLDNNLNIYTLSTTSTPSNDYQVTAFNNLPVPAVGQFRRFTLMSPTVSLRFASGSFGRDYWLKAGGAVTVVINNAGAVYFEEGDNASLGQINRFHRMQIFREAPNFAGFAGGLVTLDGGSGNIFNLPNDGTSDLIRGIQSSQAFDQGPDGSPRGGAVVWVIPSPNFLLRIQNQDFTVPPGYKPIRSPTALVFDYYKTNEPLMFVETALFWQLAKANTGWYDIPVLLTASGGGTVATDPGDRTLKVRISENTVFVRGHFTVTTTGTTNWLQLNLNLPYNFPSFGQVQLGALAVSGTIPKTAVFFETLSGSILRITTAAGNYPTVSNSSLDFTLTFQLNS